MIINSSKNTIPRPSKPKIQECYLKVDKNSNHSTSALINHKERYIQETNQTPKQLSESAPLLTTKPPYPRSEVSVEFAAKQFFQILLMNIKYNHSQSFNGLEPLLGAIGM